MWKQWAIVAPVIDAAARPERETKPALCLSDIRQWSAPHLLKKENERQERVTQGFSPSQPSPRPHGFGARAA
jgi:hypothetical protein